jgi:lysozyme
MINAVVDVSHHNKVSSFEKVSESGILAVIHKATQGSTFTDPTFAANRKRIRSSGLLLGAYHFGVAGNASSQAAHFLDVARDEDTLLVLDLEGNPQGYDMSLLEAEEFVHQVATVTGRYPGLYSGHTIKEMLLAAGVKEPGQTELSKCWLWIAQYGVAPLIPVIWPNWTLWQYTDGAAGGEPHQVTGIGRCDREQFNGSEDELRALWAPAPATGGAGG